MKKKKSVECIIFYYLHNAPPIPSTDMEGAIYKSIYLFPILPLFL